MYIGYPVLSGGKKWYPIKSDGCFGNPSHPIEYFETIEECKEYIDRKNNPHASSERLEE